MKTIVSVLILAGSAFAGTIGLTTYPDIPSATAFGQLGMLASNCERKAVYAEMSLKDKSSVWTTQFEKALSQRDDLNFEQRAFLQKLIKDIPTLLQGSPSDVKATGEQVLKVFPPDIRKDIFTYMATGGVSMSAGFLPDCNCSWGSDFNSCATCWTACISNCEYKWIGCGFLMGMPCDGQCTRPTKVGCTP